MDQINLVTNFALNNCSRNAFTERNQVTYCFFSLEKNQYNENIYYQLNLFFKTTGSGGNSLRKMYHLVT